MYGCTYLNVDNCFVPAKNLVSNRVTYYWSLPIRPKNSITLERHSFKK